MPCRHSFWRTTKIDAPEMLVKSKLRVSLHKMSRVQAASLLMFTVYLQIGAQPISFATAAAVQVPSCQ